MPLIRLNEGATLTADELRDYCNEQIAYYKVPKHIRIVEEFPMTVTGKIQKFVMREQAIKDDRIELDNRVVVQKTSSYHRVTPVPNNAP